MSEEEKKKTNSQEAENATEDLGMMQDEQKATTASEAASSAEAGASTDASAGESGGESGEGRKAASHGTAAKREKRGSKKANEEIAALTAKNDELKDKYLRLTAEYENYRKRTAKEKLELREMVKSGVMLDFLTVVDDMDRAVMHIDQAADIQAVKEGIELINHKFATFLKSQGVEVVEAKGKDFDLEYHEAVTKFPVTDETQKGKVVDEIQKGYTLNGKVIRFSKVVVGE